DNGDGRRSGGRGRHRDRNRARRAEADPTVTEEASESAAGEAGTQPEGPFFGDPGSDAAEPMADEAELSPADEGAEADAAESRDDEEQSHTGGEPVDEAADADEAAAEAHLGGEVGEIPEPHADDEDGDDGEDDDGGEEEAVESVGA